jgi:protein-disulfide isomerase
MRRARRLAPWLASLLVLGACQAKTPDDAAFGQKVRAYLLGHPEVLQEVAQRLDAKAAAQEQSDHRRAEAMLPGVRGAVEHDPQDFVAHPGGRITVTEFYDYRCPHCVGAAPKVLALIRDNPDVRFVFKEMPIFGPTSEHAARAALAVKKAGGDYLGLYQALMAAPALDDATIDRIALARGARPQDLRPGPDTAAQLARTRVLFDKLDLQGTPAFIVGDQIYLGEDEMGAIDTALAKARASRRSLTSPARPATGRRSTPAPPAPWV